MTGLRAAPSFAHLHVHTEFSLLDGACRVEEAVDAAAADGQPAIGITDHGNMYGVPDFYRACREAGINPVIGTEAYMAAESRFEKPAAGHETDGESGHSNVYYHLTLLAESTAGYRSLMKLSSDSYLGGYYIKPRVDWELLETRHEGIIATTGCLGGVVLRALLRDDVEEATRLAARLQDIFGRDSLFVELQDHGLAKQARTNPQLIEIARRIGAPLLATNDSHYVRREDAVSHDALLCVQTGASIDDLKRFKFGSSEHYLKTAAEMRHLFAHWPEACDNTLWIAERAGVQIEFGKPKLPEFPVPEEFRRDTYEESAAAYLRHLTLSGAAERYGSPLPANVSERIDHELRVIADMGFSAYFLVVWDLIRFARESRIRVGPGRGSAAGCCVAYCLRIVDLDPIRYDLYFERFLNPGRQQMPDIDIDVDARCRSDLIRYAKDRFGEGNVAQVVTFSRRWCRQAVNQAAELMGADTDLGMAIARQGEFPGPGAQWLQRRSRRLLTPLPSGLAAWCSSDHRLARLLSIAAGLEAMPKGTGIHAAAVAFGQGALSDDVPLQRSGPGVAADDDVPATQYDVACLRQLGVMLLDILPLRALSVTAVTVRLVEETRGEAPDLNDIPLDVPETFDLFSRGETAGLLQFDSDRMRRVVQEIVPRRLEDLTAAVALCRPEPLRLGLHRSYADRKNGASQIDYVEPMLQSVLHDTYGLVFYQETILQIIGLLTNWSPSVCDQWYLELRSGATGLVAREEFLHHCRLQGMSGASSARVHRLLKASSSWAYAKSHTMSYAMMSYQQGWLKTKYPTEYMVAALLSVQNDSELTGRYLRELVRLKEVRDP